MNIIVKASVFSTLILLFAGCIKGSNTVCTNKSAQSEAAVMEAYAAAQGYSVSSHPSGLYYQVVNPGSGAIPMATSKVFIKYTGRLVSSNAIFDQRTDHTKTGWAMEGLIPGLQIGLPQIAEGGTIRLIVPSELAYGCRGVGSIPGDAPIFFEIELVDVQ
jgi:FKBP-type peptidyl-prolyl cis-trans isomerase FkpA